MAKGCHCKKPGECEECPEWIFTFADLVMLMMGFFVILWVLKPEGKPKEGDKPSAAQAEWIEAVIGIRESFGWEPNPTSSDPIDQAAIRMRARNGPGEHGRAERSTQGAEGTDPEVTNIRMGKQSAVGTRMLFAAGSAELSDQTRKACREIAALIRGHRNVVLIKGHTSRDDFPEASTAEAKMDLSLRRAQAIQDHLIALGVEPEILRVTGCSTFEPVQQRAYTPEAQANNRRVEVEATSTLAEELQDNRPEK